MTEYEQIRKRFGGEDWPPRFVIYRQHLILALCLDVEAHPRIYATPAEVWVEASEHIAEWGKRLALDTGVVPVYVCSRRGLGFRSLGLHQVVDSTEDPVELAKRMAYPGIEKLSRVVFLTKLDN